MLGLAFGALLAISNFSLAADASLKAAVDAVVPPPNFAKDIVPIFQEKCQDCHHKGSMAPMSLVTYAETRPWAKAIKERVLTRQMPPWHIDKTVGVQHFKNDISLTDGQIQTIVQWVNAGAPAGNENEMPAPKEWSDGSEWKAGKQLGPPDLVISSEPYAMPAHHQDVWWRPLSDIPVTEPRWLRAVEMRPGTLAGRKITHHAVAYLAQDDQGSIDPGGIADLRGRGMLMEWAIGKSFDLYHSDTGKLLVPGAQISWDIHLHAVGEEIRDHVEIGLWFYPKGQEPKYRTYLTPFQAAPGLRVKKQLDIPPNSIVQTQGFTVLKQAAWLENFQPHMHLRGKAMAVEAILPDGTTQTISYVANFNFNWMTNYIYADDAVPVLPKGTVIHVTAWYDNTNGNPNNPDADQWVGFGDRTVDEMGHAWMNVTYISDEEYAAWAAQHKPTVQPVADRQTGAASAHR
jgi:hypothetical protein